MGIKKVIMLTSMVLGFMCLPAWLQAEDSLPVVTGIRVFRSGDNIGVEISADKKFQHTCSKMAALLRVVIDLPGTEPGKPDMVFRYKSIMISSIEVEKKSINDVMLSRVSINLNEDADYEIRTDSPDGTKLTFMFSKPVAGSSASAAATLPVKDAQVAASPGAPAASAVSPPKLLSSVMTGSNQPVTVTGVNCGTDSIEIRSSGNISEFKAFTLQKPGRLVIDIPGAESMLRSIAMPANRFGVLKARTAMFEGKLRVVLETGSKPFPAYNLVTTGTGLRIQMGLSI